MKSVFVHSGYWNIVSGKETADDEEESKAREKWPERDQKALATNHALHKCSTIEPHKELQTSSEAWNTLKENLKVKLLEEADRKLQKEGERQQIAFTAKQNSKYERFKKSDNGKRNDHQSRKKVQSVLRKPGILLLAVIQEKSTKERKMYSRSLLYWPQQNQTHLKAISGVSTAAQPRICPVTD
ncbi:hypothetical protein EVAR_100517_1 [Eumeta japonica]|uniref:Uncharacterized protein n=1 Tax=Eumeta variegata TaxID=151549 RepID=A0A4C2A6Z9_EUMVA|nr:hypothetical protein EVAR_100517_1 [Eumeta japonica]